LNPIPSISKYKVIEPRHNPQIVERWVRNHTDAIQWAWMNGGGFVSWENIFGVFMQISEHDGEMIRRFRVMANFLAPLIRDPDEFVPHTDAIQPAKVYGTAFKRLNSAGNVESIVWTLISKLEQNLGPDTMQLLVPYPPSSQRVWFDLYHGAEVTPIPSNARGQEVSAAQATHSALKFAIDAFDLGGVLMLPPENVNQELKDLLAFMAQETVVPLSNYSAATTFIPQQVQLQPRTVPVTLHAPAPVGMVLAPASSAYNFIVSGMEYEPQDYYGQPPHGERSTNIVFRPTLTHSCLVFVLSRRRRVAGPGC
jgi:iron(II)-dependent oxidoreductase